MPVASQMKAARAGQSFLDRVSPFLLVIALLGIPAAGWVALVLALQIPRLFYGQANPLLAAAEIGSLIAVLALLLLLRFCLQLPSAPRGFYRTLLDFLAISRWHSSVKVALVGLLVLTAAWSIRGDRGLASLLWRMGWAALNLTDVQDGLDRIVASYQLALTGGVPLLFALHMLTRWKPAKRVLPWVLLPLFFVGTAIGVVIVGTIGHLSR